MIIKTPYIQSSEGIKNGNSHILIIYTELINMIAGTVIPDNCGIRNSRRQIQSESGGKSIFRITCYRSVLPLGRKCRQSKLYRTEPVAGFKKFFRFRSQIRGLIAESIHIICLSLCIVLLGKGQITLRKSIIGLCPFVIHPYLKQTPGQISDNCRYGNCCAATYNGISAPYILLSSLNKFII